MWSHTRWWQEGKPGDLLGRLPGSWMDPVVVVGKEELVPVEERAGTTQQYLA